LIQENDRLIHENLQQANLIDSISHGHPELKSEQALVLINENDRLHAETMSQAKLIQSLSEKLHLATRNSNLANEELEGMQDRIDECEYKIRDADGRVRKAVEEVDEKDVELGKVNGMVKKMVRDMDALGAKNEELLV
jgi:chromosome segregation ATPase